MARHDPVEATLEQLAAARAQPGAPATRALLREVLAGRSSHAAARAAAIAGELEIDALVPDLVAAFQRFMDNPVKSDPGCAAKAAIAEALYRIGAAEIDLYLQGIHHVQPEPVWGGRADTAMDLRGVCAHALVRVHYHDYLGEIAELLADREAPARRGAAQALAYSEDPAAAPLLRLKALSGDDDPQVLNECLAALLRVARAEAVAFVARFLERPIPADAEAAALALGGSRLPEAFAVLKEWTERCADPSLRRSGLLAIAMLKQDEAIQYLLRMVGAGEPLEARQAIGALAIYRYDETLKAQVEAAVDGRRYAALRAFFKETFDAR